MNQIDELINENNRVSSLIKKHCLKSIENSILIAQKVIKSKKKIIWCGNGGSAADAQHMAAELMGGLNSHSRAPIKSIALTTDTSFLTAWSNDVGYETIFSRQIEALGNSGDLLIAISTSGNSKNIIKAINVAINNKMKIIVLTGGDGGKIKGLGHENIIIPSNNTQRIQEGHLLVEHIICEHLESEIISN